MRSPDTYYSRVIVILILAAGLCSCKKGQLLENEPPETEIFVDKIELTGENRLTTRVFLAWSGSDRDGIIKGYELSFDQINWSFVTVQDSVFLFSISSGSDTIDVDFYVRAIDNLDLRDPSPAYLKIPLKNTPPTAKFDLDFQPIDSTNVLASVAWELTDPDGLATIDSVFLKINNGEWYYVRTISNMARILPNNISVAGVSGSTVRSAVSNFPSYNIENERIENGFIDGMEVGGWNTLYIKARDIAGAFSEVDSIAPFYFRRKTSDFLVINSHDGTAPPPHPIYRGILASLSLSFDDLNMFKNKAQSEGRFWNYNFELIILQYDRIFWYTSQSGQAKFKGQELFIEKATLNMQAYLGKPASKLLISSTIPANLDPNSRLFQYTPMDSLTPFVAQQQARLLNGYLAYPQKPNYDTITLNVPSITFAAPYYLKPQAEALYTAQILASGGWSGPNVIGGMLKDPQNRTKFVFFSLELHKFNGNNAKLALVFDRIFNHEFNW